MVHPKVFGVTTSGPNSSSPVVYPAEFCTLVPGQLYKGKVPATLTSQMVKFATQPPDQRLKMIQEGISGSGGISSPVCFGDLLLHLCHIDLK